MSEVNWSCTVDDGDLPVHHAAEQRPRDSKIREFHRSTREEWGTKYKSGGERDCLEPACHDQLSRVSRVFTRVIARLICHTSDERRAVSSLKAMKKVVCFHIVLRRKETL